MQMPTFEFTRKHSKEYFYKYTSAGSAKEIFSNSSFRYSSPLTFNDPFDGQAGMHIDFNIGDYVNLFFNRLEQIVLSPQEPVFEDLNDYSRTTLFMRSKRETHGFPKQDLIRDMGPIVQSFAEKLQETHTALMQNWQNDIDRMRMFCFSETFDNILMWSYYADYHKGVVINVNP
jgi:hypothetical protein